MTIKYPGMFSFSENTLNEKTNFLRELGYSDKNIVKMIRNMPEIFSLSIDTIKEKYDELNNLGYYVKDSLVGGKFGDNCMLLDSYKDADCDDPESLPETFKKKPLVLVDHDLVYRVGQKDIKCRLSSEYLN